MLLVVAVIVAFPLIYFSLIKPFHYWSDKGVIQYKGGTIFLEICRGFLPSTSLTEIIEKIYQDFSTNRYCGVYQFLKPVLFIRDPDLIKQITVKDFDHFTDHNQILPDNSEPLWEKNLLALKGDKWRDMRSTLSPSFTSSKMKIMFGLISDCAQQFAQYFQEREETIVIEMKDTFARFTNDVIASAAFGLTCNSLKDRENEFYVMGREMINLKGFFRSVALIIIFVAPKLSKILGLEFLNSRATGFFKNIIKDNIEIREKNGIVRPDMIHLLIEASKKDNNKEHQLNEESKSQERRLSVDDITAQALIFFFAGFDTVSTLMCFMAYELAVDTDVQKRLQKEIDETLRSCNGSLTYEALMKMKYIDMVISESSRKWPGTAVADRVCVKPYTIEPANDDEKPVHLEKGSMIWVPIYALHRDPQYYVDPEKFDPERFNDENKSTINPYTFIPFGVGPRSCIGNRFALMEIKLVFCYILSKFDIVVVEKTQVPLKIAKSKFVLTSEGGFWLGLKRREI